MKPETVGELKASGLRLGFYCKDCGRMRYIKTTYPDGELLDDLEKSLRCFRCRSQDIDLRIIERDRESGFWPAESG